MTRPIRYYLLRALGVSRRKAAARTRRKRSFSERSRSLAEPLGVVILDEDDALMAEQISNHNADIAASLARRP